MKIAFCLPGCTFTKGFLESITGALNYFAVSPDYAKDTQLHMITEYSADIYNLKNTMIDKALYLGVDYLMWIDSDMVFTVDHIKSLLSRDADIVSGVAMIEPGRAAIAWQSEDSELEYYQPVKEDTGLEPVDFCGSAFLLVKADVYKKIPPIWYETNDKKIGESHRLMSEDFSFCEKARQHGFKIHVDLDVKVGHEKRWTLWP